MAENYDDEGEGVTCEKRQENGGKIAACAMSQAAIFPLAEKKKKVILQLQRAVK